MRKMSKFEPEVCVIGGANIDFNVRPFSVGKNHESTPSKIEKFFGGVARNIAENLSLLNVKVSLITAISKDSDGKELGMHCAKQNIDLSRAVINCKEETSKFIVINATEGEVEKAFSDLEILKNLTLEKMKERMEFVNQSKICVIETNLNEDILKYIAKNCKVPLFADTVSASKSTKLLRCLPYIDFIKPNMNEAARITKIEITNHNDLARSATFLLKRGVKNVCISHPEGVYYANKDEEGFIDRLNGDCFHTTVGAGDAFMAGVIYAKLKITDKLSEMVKYGLCASAVAVNTYSAVNEKISEDLLTSTFYKGKFKNTPKSEFI